MSSTVFEVVLRPEPILRRLVYGSGLCLILAGLILIAMLPVSLVWRFVFSAFWLVDGGRELRDLRRGTARLASVVLDSEGRVMSTDKDGNRQVSELLTGSMVLPGMAWLRLRSAHGGPHGELFTRQRAGLASWHRLQLLWHQARDAFGQRPGP